MDRQCGRQLYDRTCCAKQMWERLRRPMNTKQSLGRNPTSFCAQSWEAAQAAPTLAGTPCRCLELGGGGCGQRLHPPPFLLLRWPPQLPFRVKPQPQGGKWLWGSYSHLSGTLQGPTNTLLSSIQSLVPTFLPGPDRLLNCCQSSLSPTLIFLQLSFQTIHYPYHL